MIQPCRWLAKLSLVALLLAAAPARAQSNALSCREPLAAQRETQLLDAIEQARAERGRNAVSLSDALQDLGGLIPGEAGGAEVANLLGRLEMALALLGGGDRLQGMDFGEVAAVMGPLRDRLAPLLQSGVNPDDPLAMMQAALGALDELRRAQSERARVAPNRVESLEGELAALQQQCRAIAPAPAASERPSPRPLPAPEPTAAARNAFTETCDRQGGSSITYYEGEPAATSAGLSYQQVWECLPSPAGLESDPLAAACRELGGELAADRPNPTCRRPTEVPDL